MPWIITHKHTRRYDKLEEYDVETGISTGTIKDNMPSDDDYIPPVESLLCGPEQTTRFEEREATITNLDFTLLTDRTGILAVPSPVAEIDVKLSYFPEAVEQVLHATSTVVLDDTGDPDVQTIEAATALPSSASQNNNVFRFYVKNTSPSTGTDGKILKLQLTCKDTNTDTLYLERTAILYTSNEYPSDNSDTQHPTYISLDISPALIPSAVFEFRIRLREIINP